MSHKSMFYLLVILILISPGLVSRRNKSNRLTPVEEFYVKLATAIRSEISTFGLLGFTTPRQIASRTVPLSWRKHHHFSLPASFIRSPRSPCAAATRVGKWNAHTDEVKSPITINIDIRDTRRRLNCESGGNLARTHRKVFPSNASSPLLTYYS